MTCSETLSVLGLWQLKTGDWTQGLDYGKQIPHLRLPHRTWGLRPLQLEARRQEVVVQGGQYPCRGGGVSRCLYTCTETITCHSNLDTHKFIVTQTNSRLGGPVICPAWVSFLGADTTGSWLLLIVATWKKVKRKNVANTNQMETEL